MSITPQEIRNITDNLFEGVSPDAGNVEIEARIGSFTDRGHFVSNVPAPQFFKAIKYFEDMNWRQTRRRRQTTDATYREKALLEDPQKWKRIKAPKYRKTVWEYPQGTTNEKWIVKKQETDNINIPALNMRVSRQIETPLEDPSSVGVLLLESIRTKTRTSFLDPDETAYIDFTIATTKIKGMQDKKSYEVEVEMKDPKRENMPQFFEVIKTVLKAIQQTEVITTVDERTSVINKFNEIFGVRKRVLHNNFYPKPVDLTWNNFKDMFGKFKYNITEKSDGVRGFLFIIEEGVFLLQPPFGINKLAETPGDLKGYIPSLFDCEMVVLPRPKRTHILIFDTLYFKGTNMRTYAFYPRLSKARELTSPSAPTNPENFTSLTSYQLADDITISVKGFKFFTNADEMFVKADDIYKEITKQEWLNDGMIFTPVNENYHSTGIFKYKPTRLLTIDFLVKDGVPYSYTGQSDAEGVPEYVEFQGTPAYPYYRDPGIYYGAYPLDSKVIWECAYNKSRREFEPVRQRTDRQTANKLETALSVWANIMDPIGPSIYGEDLFFYFKHMELAKIKMLQKYSDKSVLDINTKEDFIYQEVAPLNIKLYSLDPPECVARSMYVPPERIIYAGAPLPPENFDAISCFFVLNYYDSPRTILEIGSKILKPGGKIFGIFMDISELTSDDLKKFEKIKLIPKFINGKPAVTAYIQSRTMRNEDIIPENKFVLFPSEIEAMAKHYGFRSRFHSPSEYKPYLSTQDNLLISIQKQFVFEKVAGMGGPDITPQLIPDFLKDVSEEELEALHSQAIPPLPDPYYPPVGVDPTGYPASPTYQPGGESPTYQYGAESPTYRPSSPEYRPSSPLYQPSSPEYRPSSPLYQPGGESPAYRPGSPEYRPSSPLYQPGGESPAYRPGSPEYRPSSPPYQPVPIETTRRGPPRLPSPTVIRRRAPPRLPSPTTSESSSPSTDVSLKEYIHNNNSAFLKNVYIDYSYEKYEDPVKRLASKYDIDKLETEGTLGEKLYKEAKFHSIKDKAEAYLPDEFYNLTWPYDHNEFEYNFKNRHDLLTQLYKLSQELVRHRIAFLNGTFSGGTDFSFKADEILEKFPHLKGVVGWYSQQPLTDINDVSLLSRTQAGETSNTNPDFVIEKVCPIASKMGLSCKVDSNDFVTIKLTE